MFRCGLRQVSLLSTSVWYYKHFLIDYLNGSLQTPFVVVDGTGSKDNINVLITRNIESLDKTKEELRKQGFDLVETEEEVQVFVVSEK